MKEILGLILEILLLDVVYFIADYPAVVLLLIIVVVVAIIRRKNKNKRKKN